MRRRISRKLVKPTKFLKIQRKGNYMINMDLIGKQVNSGLSTKNNISNNTKVAAKEAVLVLMETLVAEDIVISLKPYLAELDDKVDSDSKIFAEKVRIFRHP